jgi:DNA-binding response OmpR family regulator
MCWNIKILKEVFMTESILNRKKLLVVDDEQDILDVVREEIMDACPEAKVDTATNYESGAEALKSKDYDLVILDIMGVRGFDLLEIAVARKFKVGMLTAHALNAESLKKSHDMGALLYLPKDMIGQLIPFLEGVLLHSFESGWQQNMEKLDSYFTEKFK